MRWQDTCPATVPLPRYEGTPRSNRPSCPPHGNSTREPVSRIGIICVHPFNSSALAIPLACLSSSHTMSESITFSFFCLSPLPPARSAALAAAFSSAVSCPQLYFRVLPSLNANSSVAGAVDVRGNCFAVIFNVLKAEAGSFDRTNRGTLDDGRNGLKVALSEDKCVVFIVNCECVCEPQENINLSTAIV